MLSLQERHAAALARAMQVSRRRQDVAAEAAQLDQELLKTAGAIDVLEQLIAETKGSDGL